MCVSEKERNIQREREKNIERERERDRETDRERDIILLEFTKLNFK